MIRSINNSPFIHTILLITLLLGSVTAVAQGDNGEGSDESWYQIEILLFDQEAKGHIGSEYWPKEQTGVDVENAVTLALPETGETSAQQESGSTAETPQAESSGVEAESAQQTPPAPFEVLPEESLVLGEIREHLANSGQYETLLLVGWLQPGLPEDQAVAVRLFEGMLQPPEEEPENPDSAQAENSTGDTNGSGNQVLIDPSERPNEGELGPDGELLVAGEEEEEQEPLRFDGTVKVILSRYLHLETDLVLRKLMLRPPLQQEEGVEAEKSPISVSDPLLEADAGQEEQVIPVDTFYYNFHLQDSRRMRSNELHYIDHPLFGVIAIIRPYEPPQPDEAVNSDEAASRAVLGE